VIESERLRMRRWRPEDLAPMAALNDDPRVMEFFPARLSLAETERAIAGFEAEQEARGFGTWACDRKDTGEFIGFIGLSVPPYETPFTPCVEVRWRLAHAHWGQGFAPEGARRALDFGFWEIQLPEIVSFTAKINERSIRVMEKIGMKRDLAGDFDHPRVAPGDRLRPHVLYRIGRGLE
jgi:RimJ/RimL family protein N-acetyltransferase